MSTSDPIAGKTAPVPVPFSVLDLAPIPQGATAGVALQNSLDLARHAEAWGYTRYWLAEHHSMPGIASAATAVAIGHVAAGTSRIRVGAGGIMLPNHSPLVIAEQFGTLASLFPGRIDLGLGRAPGSDQAAARAMRRSLTAGDEFPQDVIELMQYFEPATAGQRVRAVPGEGLDVPVWILGTSLFGAQLAASLGLPFAFASHFAPAQMMEAIALYREQFRPSTRLSRPYVMLAYSVFAADDQAQAELLASSMHQSFVNLRSGHPTALPPPEANYLERLPAQWRAMLEEWRRCSVTGTPDRVREALAEFIARTAPDELMLTCAMYDHAARLRSFEIAAQVMQSLAA